MTVKRIRREGVCRCCAYPFPHRERGGKCADERDAQALQEWEDALSRMSLIQRQGRVWYLNTL